MLSPKSEFRLLSPIMIFGLLLSPEEAGSQLLRDCYRAHCHYLLLLLLTSQSRLTCYKLWCFSFGLYLEALDWEGWGRFLREYSCADNGRCIVVNTLIGSLGILIMCGIDTGKCTVVSTFRQYYIGMRIPQDLLTW
jgi:hypothetical protein